MDSTLVASPNFTFQYLSKKQFLSITGKDVKERLVKWSMKGRLQIQAFSFDQQFQSYQKDDFVLDFFRDPAVLRSLQVVSNSKWVPIGTEAKAVTVDAIPASALSMSYFDRLCDGQIAKESGAICKCFDEFYGDFVIADNLRKMLLIEDSDHYDTFTDSERDEFLFLVFRHLCLGGALCQYEDSLEPYLEYTKMIYKDLLSVQKDPSGGLHVASVVMKVSAQSEDGSTFYPSTIDHQQTFSYLVVDPLRRHVSVFYHNFGTGRNA